MISTHKKVKTPHKIFSTTLISSSKRGFLTLLFTALFFCVSGHTFAEEPQTRVITKSVLLRNISQRESGHDWTAENHNLYIGQWQMGRDAFHSAGFSQKRIHHIFSEFKHNPNVLPKNEQEIAVLRFFAAIEAEMQPELARYTGKLSHGLPISKAGILAAAHRVGTTNLKLFFRSGQCKYKNRIALTMRFYSGTTMSDSFI